MSRKVYFIRPIGMEGPVKIGCAADPEGRLHTFDLWSPFPLEIIAKMEGDYFLERRFHALLIDHHQGREWFEWCPLIAEIVAAINDGAFDADRLPPPIYITNKSTAKPDRNAELIKLYQQGHTMAECGAAFGISAVAVFHVLKRNRIISRPAERPANTQRDAALIEYFKAGHTQRACSFRFEMTRARVGQILRSHGVDTHCPRAEPPSAVMS